MFWGILIGVLAGVVGLWCGLALYAWHLQKKERTAELVFPHVKLILNMYENQCSEEIWDFSRVEQGLVACFFGMTRQEIPIPSDLLPIVEFFPDAAIFYQSGDMGYFFKLYDEKGELY